MPPNNAWRKNNKSSHRSTNIMNKFRFFLLLPGLFHLGALAEEKSVSVTDSKASYSLEFLTTVKGETHKLTVNNGQTGDFERLRNKFQAQTSVPWNYSSRDSADNRLVYKTVQVNHAKPLTVTIGGEMVRKQPPPGGGGGKRKKNHAYAVELPPNTDVLVTLKAAPERTEQNNRPLASSTLRVGVGESVKLGMRNSHLGNPEWSIVSGDAVFEISNGDSKLIAPYTSTSHAQYVWVAIGLTDAVIRLKYPKSGQAPVEVKITAVKPSGMTGVKLPESQWSMPTGPNFLESDPFDAAVFFGSERPYGSFFNAKVTATPSGVSYTQVFFREIVTDAVGVTGGFFELNGRLGDGLRHNSAKKEFVAFDSQNSWRDQIGIHLAQKLAKNSSFRWDVPIEARLPKVSVGTSIARPESAVFQIGIFPQTFTFTDADGTMIVTKFGIQHSRTPEPLFP